MNKTLSPHSLPDGGHPPAGGPEEPTDSVAGEEDPGAAMDTTGVPQPAPPHPADSPLKKDPSSR